MFTKEYYSKNAWTCFNVMMALIPLSLLFSPALSSIFIITTFIVTVLTKISNKNLSKVNKVILYAYFVFLFYHFVGLLHSENLDKALSLIIRRLPLMVIPFIFWHKYDRIDKKILFNVFQYGVLLVCLFTFCNAVYSVILNEDSFEILFQYYHRFFYVSLMPYELHPTYFGLFIGITLSICFSFINQKKHRTFQLISIILLSINLFLVSSQMITFSCFIISGIFFYQKIKVRISPFFQKTFLILVGLIITLVFFRGKAISDAVVEKFEIQNKSNIVYRVAHFFEEGDITRRKNWRSAVSVIEENFLLGVGLGDGVSEMQNYREEHTWLYDTKLNAHNQYLEEFLHFGFLGFFTFFVFIVGILILSNRNSLYLAIAFIFISVMFTESVLNRQVGIVLFSFFMSVILFKSKKLYETHNMLKKVYN